jgi:hypothetical protein
MSDYSVHTLVLVSGLLRILRQNYIKIMNSLIPMLNYIKKRCRSIITMVNNNIIVFQHLVVVDNGAGMNVE